MNQPHVLKVRRLLHLLFALGVFFVSVEHVSTYLGITMREDIVEVSTVLFFINILGLELGILVSFTTVFCFLLLSYGSAVFSLERRHEDPRLRMMFLVFFVALSGLCFGLWPSALNDVSGLIFGYTPLGWLDPVARYVFQMAIVAIGAAPAILIERKMPTTKGHN